MPGSITICVNESRQLNGNPRNSGVPVPASIQWTSSNEAVAGVLGAGDGSDRATLQGRAAGTATITASIPGTSVADTLTVTVNGTADALSISHTP